MIGNSQVLLPGSFLKNSKLALNDSGGIHGNHQLLIGGDDQDTDLGVGGGHVDLLAADLVLLLVQLDAHEGQLLGDVHTVLRAVLPRRR